MSETVGRPESLVSSDTESIAKEHTWPRGLRPNLCLIGCFFLMFNSWGLVNSYGSFASYYKEHLLANRDILLINLIGSTQGCFLLLFSVIVGRILDAGHIRKVTALGAILVPLGLFLLSVVNGKAADDGSEPGQGNYFLIWLTQGLVMGLGMTCFYVTSSQVVATWFIHRKSLAIGIVASGSSISGLIYPIMVKYLIGIQGFNVGVRYTALLTVVTSLFAFLVVQPSPMHQFRKPPQGWSSLSVWIDIRAMRNPTFVWYMASTCFMFFGFFAVFFSIEEWAASKGFALKKSPTLPALPDEQPKDSIRTFWLLSIANACSTLGRLASAYLADVLGALSIHLAFTAAGALLCLCLWTLARTFAAAIAFAVLFGTVSGAIIALPAAGIAEILGPTREAQARLGQWVGMVFSAAAAFTLTGPVVAGHLVSRYGSWLAVQLWAGLCLTVASVCMVVSRVCMARQRRRGDMHEKGLSQATTEEMVQEVVGGNDASEDGR
ncbi:MFS general substrate transporter [Viridothelium virens]|uniref:MFS general substrate transporter n=1 Tax=Viridothelium virens TaxID=1048519 RepID=A0A6A6HFZ8_VIRVR|nr:MFS general substrate transporter [Viridothelium virens]